MRDVVEARLREFVSDDLCVKEDKDTSEEPGDHREDK